MKWWKEFETNTNNEKKSKEEMKVDLHANFFKEIFDFWGQQLKEEHKNS